MKSIIDTIEGGLRTKTVTCEKHGCYEPKLARDYLESVPSLLH